MNRTESLLRKCSLCPRRCEVNRLEGRTGFCGAGRDIKIARSALHFWEEPCISGKRGSGAVFFSDCSMRCVFCQNSKISQEHFGACLTTSGLADLFLRHQESGAHNINLVSPTHYVPQIIEAISLARSLGLTLPIIYNSSGYERKETVACLEGLIDVYLPDFKYCSDDLAVKYSSAPGYFEAVTEALFEMYAQVGPPEMDSDGLITKGLIIRHLILPGMPENSKRILDWIKTCMPRGVFVSLMAQYVPLHRAKKFPEISRRITPKEYEAVVSHFERIGLINGYIQELESASEKFIPDFDLTGIL